MNETTDHYGQLLQDQTSIGGWAAGQIGRLRGEISQCDIFLANSGTFDDHRSLGLKTTEEVTLRMMSDRIRLDDLSLYNQDHLQWAAAEIQKLTLDLVERTAACDQRLLDQV